MLAGPRQRVTRHYHGRHGLVPVRYRADERPRIRVLPDVSLPVAQSRELQAQQPAGQSTQPGRQ
jgi:hypothetical protein